MNNKIILKVPGNFHISANAHDIISKKLASDHRLNYDVAHRINHLSFGYDKDLDKIKEIFKGKELNYLDKTQKTEYSKRIYEYYLKIVPTTYIDINEKSYRGNQFIFYSNDLQSNMKLPMIYFRFDISPITIKYKIYKENFLNFLVQLFAIIGGIYTLAGIIDTIINSSIIHLINKANLGKLI